MKSENISFPRALASYISGAIDQLRLTLVDRGASYADFRDNSKVMVDALRHFANFPPDVPDFVLAGLTYIEGKLARLKTGDTAHRDSYLDIAGYALLVIGCLDRMTDEQKRAQEGMLPAEDPLKPDASRQPLLCLTDRTHFVCHVCGYHVPVGSRCGSERCPYR